MTPSRSTPTHLWVSLLGLLGLVLALAVAPSPANAAPAFTASPLTPDNVESTNRSASGKLAESDPELLAREDATRIPIMVKLDLDPLASYAGDIEGFAATSPEITGKPLSLSDPAVAAYKAFLDQQIDAATADIKAKVPSVKIIGTSAVVYGGITLTIPANRASDLLAVDGVAAVQQNLELSVAEKSASSTTGTGGTPSGTGTASPTPSATASPTATASPSATPRPTASATPTATASPTATPKPTASPTPKPTASPTPTAAPSPTPSPSPTGPSTDGVIVPPLPPAAKDMDATTFIGADALWPSLGGRDHAGEGLIVGVLDTGIWPENPMLVDNGIAKPAGSWNCDFGTGSTGPAFTCNDKLVGAYAFLDTAIALGNASTDAFCTGSGTSAVCTARDADGHGTHTATTAAGSYVQHAELLGVDRGPISGVAPGASIIAYRVCIEGCYQSDSVNAVGQAILDGVDVINFSISGGTSAYTDPVELAFLDAYAAGVSVNASAGNDGPDAATANHAGPWLTTVAASTSDRAFETTLVLAAPGGKSFTQVGATVTDGVRNAPVVLATQVAGYTGTDLCLTPFAAGSVTGKVVLCERGTNARVDKGYNALQGGAAGMILVNQTLSDTETDNHWLPTVHLDGPATDLDTATDDVVDFVAANPGTVATWLEGQAVQTKGDVMAGFSSRGPLGDFLKPDVTAPGVQVLAGNTPQPKASTESKNLPGENFQAIAGTSMSSPHAAGVSLLVKAAHPTWGPGQIKSALMTSSVQDVVNATGEAAGVFDRGAGSIRADRAAAVALTISETAADFAASAADEKTRVDLNIPSINVDPLPGAISTTRTVTNVTTRSQTFTVKATNADGLRVTVSPSRFTLAAGASRDLSVVIDALKAQQGWHSGSITITPTRAGLRALSVPVVANVAEGDVTFSQTCAPTSTRWLGTSTCSVTATNLMPVPVPATISTVATPLLQVRSVSAPARKTLLGATWSGTLSPALAPTITSVDYVDAVNETPSGGYLPLSGFGVSPTALSDEGIANFTVPAFQYGSETYTRIGVVSNGYVVIGGGTAADVVYAPDDFPGPDSPNNVLAPYWTDLNPSAGGAVRVGILSGGGLSFLAVDFEEVPTYSGNATNSFQLWIELGASEGQWFTYGDVNGPDAGLVLGVGAENRDGTSGIRVATDPVADDAIAVTTAGPTAGGSVSFDYTLRGLLPGSWSTWATLTSPELRATPAEQTTIRVG